jgi:2-iminobutanoate/2-iminopropanoate deaminase
LRIRDAAENIAAQTVLRSRWRHRLPNTGAKIERSRYHLFSMKKFINLSSHRNGLPFSDAVLVDGTLYLSGRIGFVPGTLNVPDDVSLEVKYLLDGLREVLTAAEMTMNDLVHVQVFTPDVSLFDTFNSVYTKYFEGDLPARAFLGSGPLLMGARFELVAVARKG